MDIRHTTGGDSDMTELDIIKHAKGYLDKLAEGVDPLTGAVVSNTDVVKQERISKCLTYVSGVLVFRKV